MKTSLEFDSGRKSARKLDGEKYVWKEINSESVMVVDLGEMALDSLQILKEPTPPHSGKFRDAYLAYHGEALEKSRIPPNFGLITYRLSYGVGLGKLYGFCGVCGVEYCLERMVKLESSWCPSCEDKYLGHFETKRRREELKNVLVSLEELNDQVVDDPDW